jgi:MOSC domain-containing protein YiiM
MPTQGIFAKVLSGGRVKMGDTIELMDKGEDTPLDPSSE